MTDAQDSACAGRPQQIGMFRLQTLDSTTSTNDEIKRALEQGEPEGLAISARVQTAGYGRQGRAWSSPQGGMYVSCLLRPRESAEQLPTLGIVAALAARRAVQKAAGANVPLSVKWPNDIVVGPGSADASPARSQDAGTPMPLAKLCGISSETHAGGVCIGIGMNVIAPPDRRDALAQGAATPAYLCDFIEEGGADDRLVAQMRTAVLAALSDAYATWQEQGFATFLPEYEACDALVGRNVSLENINGETVAEGVVSGIDGQGRLLICPSYGEEPRAFSSGEVHLA